MWSGYSLKTKITIVGTAITIIGGTFTVINQADLAEGHWFATRGFVRTEVTQQRSFLKSQLVPLEQRQISQELNQVGNAIDTARDKQFDLKVLSDRNDLSPEIKKNVEHQKQDLQDRIDALTSRRIQLRQERN